MSDSQGWHRDICPGCGKGDWCQQHDNGTAMCYRGPFPGAVERRDRNGVPFWLFLPVDLKPARISRPSGVLEPAEARDLALVYGALLASVGLTDGHRAELRARGLSDEAIGRHAFRSWPEDRDRAQLAANLFREFGSVCHHVPGLYARNGTAMLAGGSGWVLPAWNTEGQVVALRFRSDRPNASPRYYWISSRKHGGPSSGSHSRLAWPSRQMRKGEKTPTLRIVEGEIKAIVMAETSGTPTLSIPGVASWRKALPWLKLLGVSKVLLCFDSDFREKRTVARALLGAFKSLAGLGFQVALETWKEVGRVS